MTGAHNLFAFLHLSSVTTAPPPPAQGYVEDFDFLSAFPHSNHHTVWRQLAGKTVTVRPRSLLLYCTAMFVYVYQTSPFSPHYGDNVKVKSQHICQAIPALLRGLDEAVVTNDWCIIYGL